jgi:hypothetical protein
MGEHESEVHAAGKEVSVMQEGTFSPRRQAAVGDALIRVTPVLRTVEPHLHSVG